MGLDIPVIALELPSYQRKENFHFNVLLYPETGESAARYCEKTFGQPYTKVVPIGAGATHDFIAEIRALTGSTATLDTDRLRQTWWSRSVDSTYLTGKRVFIFGDGTHVKAAARIARDEFEGANVIFDTWIHPLVMGLEEHLLHMFRDDFEFHDAAGPSHHGGHAPKPSGGTVVEKEQPETGTDVMVWLADAEKELKKIPFFVRGKARRNTETYAADKGLAEITLDTLYEAKAHYAR